MTRHRGLIVEDEKATAEDLADVVGALGFESIVVDNQLDALDVLQRETICFALLDLEIKLKPDSIRRNPEAGASLVRELRRLYPQHAGVWQLPLLVVSGHAREVQSAVKIMREGATDLIEKPFESRELSQRIRQALQESGRADHVACLGLPRQSKVRSNAILITIPADRDKRRSTVLVNGNPLPLTDSMLRLLLQLIVGKQSGQPVHTRDLGGTGNSGHRAPSELRKLLAPVLPKGINIIGNDYNGSYWLTDEVEVGDCDTEKLGEIGDRRITELAKTIGKNSAGIRERKV